MKYMLRLKQAFLLFACLILLSGCTVRVAYGMLDTLLNWQLGKYVSLKGNQKKVAKNTFEAFHTWHRATQLTLYAEYLKNLKTGMLAGNITGDFLHKESDKLQDLLDESVAYLVPGLTQIASSLSDEQIEEVVENLVNERDEYREDYIDDDDVKIQKRRINDLTRYVGGFFGAFTEEQEALLKNWESNLVPHEQLMMTQQIIWQNEFIDAMNYQDDLAELQKRIHALMLVRTDNWDPELQRVLDINQRATFDMLATLFNSQTPKQRKKLEKKFDQYINDLTILAAKATP